MDVSVSRIENNKFENKKRENSVTSDEFREVISKLDENIEENEGEEKEE
jgi:predicted AlkP superfamily phosphohydrolase/phosphomutase